MNVADAGHGIDHQLVFEHEVEHHRLDEHGVLRPDQDDRLLHGFLPFASSRARMALGENGTLAQVWYSWPLKSTVRPVTFTPNNSRTSFS